MGYASYIVGIFARPGSPLGAAIAAALAVRGWVVDLFHEVAFIEQTAAHRVVLVVEPDDGPVPHLDTVVSRHTAIRWICLGSMAAARQLAMLARLGVAVLNPDVPFLRLLSHIERLLVEASPPAPRIDLAVAIESRAGEAESLGLLTNRERTVLCHLMRGATVAEIAEHSSRTIHTIRSQVQSLMRQLGARSQVEAVAIGHRSGAQTPLAPCLERIHQYW
jgi:DNA-binding NarL/FixJ family response regulator